MRRIAFVAGMSLCLIFGLLGCAEKEKKCEEEGTHVNVDVFPYAKVRVHVPKGKEENTRVDVDVDD